MSDQAHDRDEATPEQVDDAMGTGSPEATPLLDHLTGEGGDTASQTLPSELSPEEQEAPPTGYDEAVDDTFPASDPPAHGPTT